MIEFFYGYLLPLALTFGMPNKEFWEEDPELLWAYRKSYIAKKKFQSEIQNYNAWLNGLYVYDAINKSIYNNFNRKGNQKTLNYIEKPYDFNAKHKDKKELEKERRAILEEKIKEKNKKIKELLRKSG